MNYQNQANELFPTPDLIGQPRLIGPHLSQPHLIGPHLSVPRLRTAGTIIPDTERSAGFCFFLTHGIAQQDVELICRQKIYSYRMRRV